MDKIETIPTPKQDGFPEPIREEMPWLVRNEPGG